MHITRKYLFVCDTEYTAGQIIKHGPTAVEEAISLLGRIVDRSDCVETIRACEKLIEVLNEGPQTRTIYQLTEDQSRFAAKIMSAVHDCVTLAV